MKNLENSVAGVRISILETRHKSTFDVICFPLKFARLIWTAWSSTAYHFVEFHCFTYQSYRRPRWHGIIHTPFFNFLFTYLFSMKFLYFFIISSLFPYFNMFVSIFIQFCVNSNFMCRHYNII